MKIYDVRDHTENGTTLFCFHPKDVNFLTLLGLFFKIPHILFTLFNYLFVYGGKLKNITSFWRGKYYNDIVLKPYGSVPNSKHITGMAVDYTGEFLEDGVFFQNLKHEGRNYAHFQIRNDYFLFIKVLLYGVNLILPIFIVLLKFTNIFKTKKRGKNERQIKKNS